jgi:hypothetical protein
MGEAGEAFWARAGAVWDREKPEKIIKKRNRLKNLNRIFLLVIAPAEFMHTPSVIPAGSGFYFVKLLSSIFRLFVG